MKVNVVKLILALGFGAILGLLCYQIAGEEASRNLISFAVAGTSMFLSIGMLMGFEYENENRGVNIKTAGTLMATLLLVVNIVFSCFAYGVLAYVGVVGFLTLLDIALIYSMYKPKN